MVEGDLAEVMGIKLRGGNILQGTESVFRGRVEVVIPVGSVTSMEVREVRLWLFVLVGAFVASMGVFLFLQLDEALGLMVGAGGVIVALLGLSLARVSLRIRSATGEISQSSGMEMREEFDAFVREVKKVQERRLHHAA